MAGAAAAGTGAGARGQALVAGVFPDYQAGMVTEDADGRVNARAAEVPDASEGAGEHGGEVGKGSAPAPSPVFDWQAGWLASDER